MMKQSLLVLLAMIMALTRGFSVKTNARRVATSFKMTDSADFQQGCTMPQEEPFRLTRRDLLNMSLLAAAVLVPPGQFAVAAGAIPTSQDLDRIKTGYQQITALVNNFDAATTVCREGGGGDCKRNADPIRKALGLRSTTDPLFQIDKVFAKVKNMDTLDPDKLDAFFEATEDWNSAITMSNSMAFISQFGEYNPGGGKDEVLKYLNESKKQLLLAQKALGTIMDCLDLS